MDTAISIKIETLNVHMSTFTEAAGRGFDIPANAELVSGCTGYTKVLAGGNQVASTDPRTDHVAVIDHATGLMWTVESLGDPKDADDGISQADCEKRCKDLTLLGHSDWRLPTRTELAGLVDDTRHEPAIDTALFPRVKPRWHWTSTPWAGSPGSSAWGVHFYDGSVNYSHRGSDGFALAVRRAGQ